MAAQGNPIDSNLANSIAMLEQILEVMPQDIDAIKAVYSAHRKIGNNDKAFEYLNRLIEVVVGSGTAEDLRPFIQFELTQFEEQYPDKVASQVARLRILAESSAAAKSAQGSADWGKASATATKKEADISEELALAWRMYEENQLTQEEYSSVVHDMTEVSSKDLEVPASILHVLNDRAFPQMKRIMSYMSTRSGAPCISLSNFELNEDAAKALPIDLPSHDGALPFAILGDDLLVGVLNPFNNRLVDKIEAVSGRRCHTFLVGPEDYDKALLKLRALIKTN